jgi:hypothetical protein
MVRKVAERGQPTAWPVRASISSTVRSISCMRRITLSTEKVPMRLAMKLGVSFASTTPLPSCCVAEVGDGRDQRGVGIGRRDQFQQAHIAGRIKEVSAEPGAPEVVGKTLGNFGHGKSAGVGGDDGAGLADRLYFF